MSNTPSQPPTRFTSGFTEDMPFQPLADCGVGDPFFYHLFSDDFDNTVTATGLWTFSLGSGTIAQAAGDGGLVLMTTAAVSTDQTSMQLPAAGFLLPQGTTIGKKLFFATRIALGDVTACNVLAGLITTTATPFTGTNIQDGIYFWKASGGKVLNIITASGGTLKTWVIPAAAYSLVNATNIDLAFYVDKYQNLNVYVGSQLFGFMPQSGSGGVNAQTGVSNLPVLGRVLQVTGPSYPFPLSGGQLGPWTVSAANLNVSLGIQTEAAAAKTLTADFIMAAKER